MNLARARGSRPLPPESLAGREEIKDGGPQALLMYLSYTGIRATNLERSLKFYKGLFGLEEVARGDGSMQGTGVYVLLRDKRSGEKLELNWYPSGSRYDTPFVAGEGLDHLAFSVENVEEKYKELVGKGAKATDFGHEVGASYRYVKDPDGNWIELYQQKVSSTEPVPKGY